MGPAPEAWVRRPNVYGKFPAFDPYIDAKSVERAVERLAPLERDFVVEVVNSFPAQWGSAPMPRSRWSIDLWACGICGEHDFRAIGG